MVTQRFRKAIIITIALLTGFKGRTQTPGLGHWNVINARYDINKTWNLFVEGQARSQKLPYDYFYNEIKGGLGYTPARGTNLLVGVGKYTTYQLNGNFKSPVQFREFRLWEQLTFNNEAGPLKFEHRYRIEQRFYKGGNYRNRFRYRINATLPIPNSRFYINGFEEVFLTNRSPYFERNRLYVGAGYKFTSVFTFQVGYVSQYDYNRNINPYTKKFLQTSFLFNLNKHQKQEAKQPATDE
jgi:hypothetical protein